MEIPISHSDYNIPPLIAMFLSLGCTLSNLKTCNAYIHSPRDSNLIGLGCVLNSPDNSNIWTYDDFKGQSEVYITFLISSLSHTIPNNMCFNTIIEDNSQSRTSSSSIFLGCFPRDR